MSGEIVPFMNARPGQSAYVYDVRDLHWDYAWETDPDAIEECVLDCGEVITVKRQLWQLIEQEEVTFSPTRTTGTTSRWRP